jgi:hypothetical protein
VPHGHLIDAAAHENVVAMTDNSEINPGDIFVPAEGAREDVLIAQIIAENADIMEFEMNSGSTSTDVFTHFITPSGEGRPTG